MNNAGLIKRIILKVLRNSCIVSERMLHPEHKVPLVKHLRPTFFICLKGHFAEKENV